MADVKSDSSDSSNYNSDSTSSPPLRVVKPSLHKLVQGVNEISQDIYQETQILVSPEKEYTKKQISQIFPQSTHQYVIFPCGKYNEDQEEVTCTESASAIALGLLVILIQYVLYSVIMLFAFEQYLTDLVPVEVDMYEVCEKNRGRNISLNALQCDYNLAQDKTYLMIAAMLLPAIFLQNDYLSCIRIWFYEDNIPCCGKFMAFLVFGEALFASITCSLLAYNAVWMPNGAYTCIMDTIGVLFIHDIDEKLYHASGVITKMGAKKCACCCSLFKDYVTWIFLGISVAITAFFLPKLIWEPAYEEYTGY